MLKRYAIWDKKFNVYTPSGEKFTPEQWMERYPIAALESVTVVCDAGDTNGAFFGTLNDMVRVYTNAGCDFSECETAEEKLELIEAFEDEMNKPAETGPSAQERQAAALEAIAAGQTTENAAAVDALLNGEV